MIKIGIVGAIGSGKSFVSKQFFSPVFNADVEVNKIYKKDRVFYKKLNKLLPKFKFSFPIKKQEIIYAILNQKNSIKKIVKIVHPIVRKKMKKFLIKNKNKKIVILDIPLLLENKLAKKDYIIIFVDAKKKDILKNLIKRKNYNIKILNKLRKIQIPLKLKKKKSNYIIKNNFKSINIKKRVNIIKNEILKK